MPQPHQELQKLIAQTDPEVMKNVETMLKAHREKTMGVTKEPAPAPVEMAADPADEGMNDQAHAAVKAIVRIASPFKGKIPPVLMHQIMDAAGFELTTGEDQAEDQIADQETGDPDPETEVGESGAMHVGDGHKEAGFMAIPEAIEGEEDDVLKGWEGEPEEEEDSEDAPVMKSHMHEAAKKAHDVYKEHMEKLGYKKYPDAQMHMKAKPEMFSSNKDGKPVSKEKGEKVSKAATTAPNLSTVDPATRREMEAVFKSNKELVKKNADLEARIEAGEKKEREKEIVAKAATFTHVALPQDEIIETLKDADKLGTKSFERVCKSFETLNEQGKTSKLFGEFGSNLPGSGNSSESAWLKIEKAAEGYVAKSGAKMGQAEAVDAFLKTSEGQRMYAEYKDGRKGGI